MEFHKLPVFIHPSEFCFSVTEKTSQKQILTVYNPYDFSIKFKIRSTNPKRYSVNEAEGVIECRGIVDIAIRHLEVNEQNINVRDKFRVQLFENESMQNPPTLIGQKEFTSVVLPSTNSSAASTPRYQREVQSVSDNLVCSIPKGAASNVPSSQPSDGREANFSKTPTDNNSFCTSSSPASCGNKRGMNENEKPGPSTLAVAVAFLCVVALLLPIADVHNSQLNSGSESRGGSSSSSEPNANSQALFSFSLIPSFLHVTVNQKLTAAFTLGLLTMAMLQNA